MTDDVIEGRYPPLVARHLISRRHFVLASLAELRGMNLACWCAPSDACHADLLLELANREEHRVGPRAVVEEVEQFERRHPIGSKARLALALLMYTGVRRSDVVRLGRQHVRNGWFKIKVQKNRERKPVTLELPVLPALQEMIAASPAGDLTFLVTQFGRPFTANGFGNWFRRRCNEAGLSECSAHGLRKAGAVRAAENGATTHELMAIFGWHTVKEAERYTQAAQRRRLASNAGRLLGPRRQEEK